MHLEKKVFPVSLACLPAVLKFHQSKEWQGLVETTTVFTELEFGRAFHMTGAWKIYFWNNSCEVI